MTSTQERQQELLITVREKRALFVEKFKDNPDWKEYQTALTIWWEAEESLDNLLNKRKED